LSPTFSPWLPSDRRRQYSPTTAVFNQCANSVLAYIVKSRLGKLNPEKDVTTNLDGSALPAPPRRGDVDVLVGGFPWCAARAARTRRRR
jgi:hypothetical protein